MATSGDQSVAVPLCGLRSKSLCDCGKHRQATILTLKATTSWRSLNLLARNHATVDPPKSRTLRRSALERTQDVEELGLYARRVTCDGSFALTTRTRTRPRDASIILDLETTSALDARRRSLFLREYFVLPTAMHSASAVTIHDHQHAKIWIDCTTSTPSPVHQVVSDLICADRLARISDTSADDQVKPWEVPRLKLAEDPRLVPYMEPYLANRLGRIGPVDHLSQTRTLSN